MPSFDIVSEIDMHEVANAVDQANREVGTRFDFKGTDASYERAENVITQRGSSDFQLQQMREILYNKLTKRGIDIRCTDVGESEQSGKGVKQTVTLRQGVDADLARKLIRLIKDAKLKVQTAIQGDQVRVTGKKRDDLQEVIAMLRKAELAMPLQFNNFRD